MKNFERYFASLKQGNLHTVFRWIRDDGKNVMDRWDGKKWVDCPGLIRVTGIGGATGMRTITKKQVDEFTGGKKGGEGSGHHDHGGLSGVWGGSTPSGRAPAKKPTAKKPPTKKPPKKKPPAKKPPEKPSEDELSPEDIAAQEHHAAEKTEEGRFTRGNGEYCPPG